MKNLLFGSCVLIMSATVATAAFFDTDSFSSGYDANVSIDGKKQWTAVGAIVTNDTSVGVTNDWAVYFPESSSATNTVDVAGPSKAWTDFQIKPALGAEPADPPTNTTSALLLFNITGAIQVWDGTAGNWITCTNDVWGFPLAKITNEYVRVSVYQNFSNKTYAVMMDDRVIVQDVGFPKDNIDGYNQFVVQNVENNAYLDDLFIKLEMPVTLTASSNHVAMADAQELDQYGYVARTLHVDPANTAPVPYYASLQAALDAYRTNDLVTIAAGTYTENITISRPVTFTNAVIIAGTLDITGAGSLTASSGLTVSNSITLAAGTTLSVTGNLSTTNAITLANNATLSANTLTAGGTISLDGGSMTVTGALNAQAITLENDATLAAGGTLTAGGAISLNGSSLTVAGAFNAQAITLTNNATLSAHSTLTAGGTISLDGGSMTVTGALNAGAHAITLANNATLTADGTLTAGAVAVNTGSILNLNGNNNAFASLSAGGKVAIGEDKKLDIAGVVALSVDVGSTGTVTIASGGTLTINVNKSHTMTEGTTIVATGAAFYDGTLNINGTFTIHGANYIAAKGGEVLGQPLPFSDNFDRYGSGTLVSGMKVFGWNATAGTSPPSVTNTPRQGSSGNSIILPDGSSVTLKINDANKGARNVVWTDYYIQPAMGVGPADIITATNSFMSFVNASSNLVVYDSGSSAWVECNYNKTNGTVEAAFSTELFTRVTIYQNFTTRKYVVFINGTELVHEGTFPDTVNVPNYTTLLVDNTSGGANAWLDTVLVTASLPAGLTGDHDGDGVYDGWEIHSYGDLGSFSGVLRGSLFRFL